MTGVGRWGSLTLSVEANSLVPYFTQLGALRQHGLPSPTHSKGQG